MQITKQQAISQVNQMVDIVNQLGKTIAANTVVGETITATAPAGVQMIVAK